jgi:hypothetical protein
MTIVTIESDSDKKTEMLVHYAEELGLTVKTDEHRALTDNDVLFGFGRKATDAELTEYLLSTEEGDEDCITIEALRAKYPNH